MKSSRKCTCRTANDTVAAAPRVCFIFHLKGCSLFNIHVISSNDRSTDAGSSKPLRLPHHHHLLSKGIVSTDHLQIVFLRGVAPPQESFKMEPEIFAEQDGVSAIAEQQGVSNHDCKNDAGIDKDDREYYWTYNLQRCCVRGDSISFRVHIFIIHLTSQ